MRGSGIGKRRQEYRYAWTVSNNVRLSEASRRERRQEYVKYVRIDGRQTGPLHLLCDDDAMMIFIHEQAHAHGVTTRPADLSRPRYDACLFIAMRREEVSLGGPGLNMGPGIGAYSGSLPRCTLLTTS